MSVWLNFSYLVASLCFIMTLQQFSFAQDGPTWRALGRARNDGGRARHGAAASRHRDATSGSRSVSSSARSSARRCR